ncbi:transcription initiation factor TFIIE subunit beta, partial [Phenoliferia sp. Uapishka_3]
PDFALSSKADLLTLIRRAVPKGGLNIKQLRESWAGVGAAIEELEKEGKVLVTRAGGDGKEGSGVLKAVFLDEIGKTGGVDKEFVDLWAALRTPLADDLASKLEAGSFLPSSLFFIVPLTNQYYRPTEGLTASSVVPTAVVKTSKKKGRKGAGQNNRRLKITNTHLKVRLVSFWVVMLEGQGMLMREDFAVGLDEKDIGIDVSKDYVPIKKK